ncbi:isoprenylcysteine carboxylmethyltransferase family protein [candidate division WOR-3 bacterium]|nr:isoprenylcysteine carboxylmethyltransferase family protein [candidate division WOR-3 bacterium]
MSLRKKLIEIFYKAATSSKQIRTLLTPVGLIIFFIIILLFIVVSLQMDKFLELPKLLHTPLNIIVSLPILAIGLFLILWSILHFIKVKGTPVPFNPPPKLVTTGPYAHVRNPMLTGVFILLFGFGVLFRTISLVFIFTPIFILFNVLELKTIEEPELEKRLGKEYIEYKKRVHMFIPWLKVRTKKRFVK